MNKHPIGLTLWFILALALTGCRSSAPPEPAPPPETTVILESAAALETTAAEPSAEMETETAETAAEPAAELSLDAEQLSFEHRGEQAVIYSGPLGADEIFWSSEDVTVAFAYQGTVYAVGPGETVIRGEYNGQEFLCQVSCTMDPAEPKAHIPSAALRAPQMKIPDMADAGDYFDDVIIMGDSTSHALYTWSKMHGEFPNTAFLVRGSASLHSLISGQKKYFHQGVEKRVEDAVHDCGKRKLFLMLGINDISIYGAEGTLELLDTMLNLILEKTPDLEIYLESVTPIRAREQGHPYMTNEEFDRYNVLMEAYAQERGYRYVPLAPYFKDNENSMVISYSRDNVHSNEAGLDLWIRVLKQYAAAEMEGE